VQALNKPSWLKVKLPTHSNFFYVSSLVEKNNLHTICQSAKCPNASECWSQKTATFLILGDICTRNCGFCAVKSGEPHSPVLDESKRVAESVAAMELQYAVITSVTRDDLTDGGASIFVDTINAIREISPLTKIETLIPDFGGKTEALASVIAADPEVLNHNIEVPESLYSKINRPQENYRRSLQVLENASRMGAITKSGLMLGLGESEDEIIQTFQDLINSGCKLLTVGQYLQPRRNNALVEKYYPPADFARFKAIASEMGFKAIESDPLVRSSYHAHQLYDTLRKDQMLAS